MTVAKFQTKRSYDAGVTPNTTSSSNGTFIDSGELAVNFGDGRLYTSNGSSLVVLGQNVVTLYVNTSIQIGANATINSTYYTGEAASANSVGGATLNAINTSISTNAAAAYANAASYADARAAAAYSNAIGYYTGSFVPTTGGTFSGNVSFGNSTVNTTINSTAFSGSANNASYLGGVSLTTIRTEITGNSATAFANAIANAASNAASIYQTMAGLSANVATLTSNNSNYLSGVTVITIRSEITGNSATAYSNATTYASNATNLTTGTLPTARLPATVNVSTQFYVGANVSINTTAMFVGNSTVNTTINSTAFAVNGNTVATAALAIAFAVAL